MCGVKPQATDSFLSIPFPVISLNQTILTAFIYRSNLIDHAPQHMFPELQVFQNLCGTANISRGAPFFHLNFS